MALQGAHGESHRPRSPPSMVQSLVNGTVSPMLGSPTYASDTPRTSTMFTSGAFTRPPSTRSFLSSRAVLDTEPDPFNLRQSTVVNQYALPSDPRVWSQYANAELDDDLHDPKKQSKLTGPRVTWRTFLDTSFTALIGIGIVILFAGYPVIHYFTTRRPAPVSDGSLNFVSNATGKIPSMRGRFAMIDPDTPPDAHTRASWMDPNRTLQLVWSDEFELPGRTFYPGDDPFWEAVDLHYWQTGDLEWYDPAAIMTRNGALEITLSQKQTHGLNYQGGMMSTWNSFCFTGGVVEVASSMPGAPNVQGLWPAIWTMGNLGRVGYGASTDGLWPYSYDSCDYGTIAHQSANGQPPGAFTPGGGDPFAGDQLSLLPGQKLSRCTCKGESHPGPRQGGQFVGRSAPEIDVFESQAAKGGARGNVSQSAQIAPFNDGYYYFNGSGTYAIYNSAITGLNTYHGGAYQQALSALTHTDQECYELTGRCFSVYGIEYLPGFDDAYISWISNNQLSWTITSAALAADPNVQIGPRPISMEPMYLIMNLGMAPSFQPASPNLQLPATMRIDYIRVYQDPDSINTGCDPKNFPTMDYIKQYTEAYSNPNLTQWSDLGLSFPKNSFLNQC